MNDEYEDDYTIDCPECGKAIYEDAPQCPHCGTYVTSSRTKKLPAWVVVIIVLTILSFLLPFIF